MFFGLKFLEYTTKIRNTIMRTFGHNRNNKTVPKNAQYQQAESIIKRKLKDNSWEN
jgi:hypothetical protein